MKRKLKCNKKDCARFIVKLIAIAKDVATFLVAIKTLLN